MEIAHLLTLFLSGLSYSLLLFLLAAGLSLIFGLMGFVNLAHGSLYMLGAYFGLTIIAKTGNFFLSILFSGLMVAVIGFGMNYFFFRHLYRQHLNQVLLTFGLTYIIADLSKWYWGGNPLSLSEPKFLSGAVNIIGSSFPKYRLFVIIIGLAIAVLLWFFLEKTKIGAVIRAGVNDNEMVDGLGINIKYFFALTVGLGALLAGIAGVLGGPILGAYQGLDFDILTLTLVVVVVGGLGSLSGVILGSIVIGFIDTFGKALFPDFSMFFIYVVMIVVLLIKPAGLLGREGH